MDGIASQGPLAQSCQIDVHFNLLVTMETDTVEHTMVDGWPALCQTITKGSLEEGCISQDMVTVIRAQKMSGFAIVVVFMCITSRTTIAFPAIIDTVQWLINGI